MPRLAGMPAALGIIGKAAIPAASGLLKDKDNRSVLAASVLDFIGPAARATVPALVELLKDRDAEVRRAAASALAGIGPAARLAVPRSLNCSRIVTLKFAGRRPRLWQELGRRPGQPRRRWPSRSRIAIRKLCAVAASAVAGIGRAGRVAAPALAELLKDGQREVRSSAKDALSEMVWRDAAIPVLVELITGADEHASMGRHPNRGCQRPGGKSGRCQIGSAAQRQ